MTRTKSVPFSVLLWKEGGVSEVWSPAIPLVYSVCVGVCKIRMNGSVHERVHTRTWISIVGTAAARM